MASSNNGNNQGASKGNKQAGAASAKQGGNKQAGNRQSGDTSNRGFASMDPAQQRQIAAEGGRAAHAAGTAHQFTSEEARRAGAMSHKNSGNRQSAGAASSSGNSAGNSAGSSAGNQQGGRQDSGAAADRQSGADASSQSGRGGHSSR